DKLVRAIVRRTVTTAKLPVADVVSWTKVPRNKYYIGSQDRVKRDEAIVTGSSMVDVETLRDTGVQFIPEHILEDILGGSSSCATQSVEEWKLLSKRQRQRRREGSYWGNVLKHSILQLRRQWLKRRWEDHKHFMALMEEYSEVVAREQALLGSVKAQRQANSDAQKTRRTADRSSDRTEERKVEVCLIDALRSLGVPLQYTDNGPFWALRDGNRMLLPHKPLGMQILPMASVEDIDVGKYVLHWNNHFTSLQVWGDGSYMWRPTLRRHVGKVGRWNPTILRQGTRVFKLACGAADGSYAAMGNAGVAPPPKALDVQGGADLSSWTSISRVDPVERLQICHARARTLERKRAAPVSVKIHEVPDEEDLVSKGFSREQAARYRAALTEAIARRRFMQLWSVSMPPMIWQTFGSDQEPA
ncbi:unnamed protein product, partial [Effrenium voratum]